MCNAQGNLVRRRRSRGRSQTTVPRISRHVAKRGAETASLMYQRRQGTIGRTKTLGTQDDLRRRCPERATKKEWERFDHDLDQVLEASIAGDVGRKENRCLKEIAILRDDMRRLKKAFHEATGVEKLALTEIQDNLRERIKILHQAECHRRDRKRWTKERVDFIKNPFKYLSDPRREDSLEEIEKLIKPAESTIPFGAEEPSWHEVNNFLKKARGKSAPGTNGIPYKVYKYCERFRRRLWKLLRVAWRKNFLTDDQRGHHPTVQEKPVKSLGKWYRANLNEKASVKEMLIQAETWMTSLEKSGLPGKYKAWGYQHGVFPRLLWPLLVYEVPVSTVEGLERKMNTYLRRWLGHRQQAAAASNMVEEYKATKTRHAMMLRDSQDARVCQADIEVRTGRKWSASRALREAEDSLQHTDIVGSVAQGRLGLGCQGKLGQGQPEGEAWHCAEGGPQGRGGKATCQGYSHEQAGQLDKVGERVRKGTELAEYLEHGRTTDQVSAVFCV
ncbi:hypothetical protein N1851_026134 [Merluccius polli]|uniref:Uncharacterized protein n=1 Tax=Merluccius polli TaxID=89951 RepID=A0AA47MCP1_MERPO|nr:hypothetical protein N1851_026134 [Merluccius polli]